MRVLSVNKRKREKVCMKTNDRERLVRKTEKHIRHLVLNVRDLPAHLAFDLAFVTGSSVGNATWLALLRHCLAFTNLRRAGYAPQRCNCCVPAGIVMMEQTTTPVRGRRLHHAWKTWQIHVTFSLSVCLSHIHTRAPAFKVSFQRKQNLLFSFLLLPVSQWIWL